jgi:CHASE3 domain sensor protein
MEQLIALFGMPALLLLCMVGVFFFGWLVDMWFRYGRWH